MSESFELVEPFGVDLGELADCSPEDAFVLGAEWSMFRAALTSEPQAEFEYAVHRKNLERCVSMARRHGYRVTAVALNETWQRLSLDPRPHLRLVKPC